MYTVDAYADEPIMKIDRHIGYDPEDGMGVDGPSFAAELLALDAQGKKRIQIWINSPGGKVMDGFDIYSAILRTKTPVDTYCMGVAASISAVLFQAGRNRIMADYGVLMYHNPFGDAQGDAIAAMKTALCTMVAKRSGMSDEQVSNMMNATTYLTAQEAKMKGLCDTVQASEGFNTKRLNAAEISNDMRGYWKEANTILNNAFKNEQNMPELTRICNRLKLVPQANEDAILEAIQSMENKQRETDAALAAANAKITGLETEKTQLTTTVNSLKAEKEAAEKAANKVQATALVEAAIKLGVIKNEADAKAKWLDRATANYADTKELIDSLSVNKVSNKITIDTPGTPGVPSVLDNAVAAEMGAILNRLKKQEAKQ